MSGLPITLTNSSYPAPIWQPSDAPIPAPFGGGSGGGAGGGGGEENRLGGSIVPSVPDWLDDFCKRVILSGPLYK